MKKVMNICWKDLALLFRDRAALIFMLLAPFLLTLGMGAVTGSLSGGGSSGVQDIPVVIVNQDEGVSGKQIVAIFEGQDKLFNVTTLADVAAARKKVEDDKAAAAVIVPTGFSDSLMPGSVVVPVEVYSNPGSPISASVVRSVLTGVLNQMETIPASLWVAVNQLQPNNPEEFNQQMIPNLIAQAKQSQVISLQLAGASEEKEQPLNAMAYFAPGMAIFFLMYTVTQGGRSILAERDHGTLPRMLISPTSSAEILGGKLLSIVVMGILQVGVLILASSLLFQLNWGDPLAVVLLVVCVVLAATGWGILLASIAKTRYQVSNLGLALMLLFGILGGTFVGTGSFTGIMRMITKITPHAWALDGFTALNTGKALADILPSMAGLLAMAAILFVVSILVARRRWASGFMGS
jgi:ABC-2 type transport system permease protein